MQEDRELITLEVITLTVLSIGVCCGLVIVLLRPPEWLIPIVSFLADNDEIVLIAILIFNAIWFISLKLWSLENVHIKLVSSSLLVAFSAAFIVVYVIDYLLQDFSW